jgi:hypothetical protein
MMIGLIVPYVFYFYLSLITGISFNLPKFPEIQLIEIKNLFNLHIIKKSWVIVVAITSLFGFVELSKWLYKKSIKSRKSFIILFFYLTLTLILSLFTNNLSESYLLLTPLSIVIANYFIYTRNRFMANILFFLLFFASILYKYFINI